MLAEKSFSVGSPVSIRADRTRRTSGTSKAFQDPTTGASPPCNVYPDLSNTWGMTVPDEDVMRLDIEGSVHHHLPVSKAQEWRVSIRKVAREMGWTIRTGYQGDVELVWASRLDFEAQDPEAHEGAIAQSLDERWRRGRRSR